MRISMILRLLPLSAAAIMSACASSPYYVEGQAIVPGEVPRDVYGQPLLDLMSPAPDSYQLVRPSAANTQALAPLQPLPLVPQRPGESYISAYTCDSAAAPGCVTAPERAGPTPQAYFHSAPDE